MVSEPNSFFEWIVFIWGEYGILLLKGAAVTLILALIGTLIGCIIGLVVGIIKTIELSQNSNILIRGFLRAVQAILTAYVEIFRGTPMIVQAMVLYYGSLQMFGIDMSAMFAGFFVVSINTGAYMAETVRGGIVSIDPGQTEAAKAIGMTHYQTMRYVILPQALRYIMPQIGNNLIINIKDTSVLNVIAVTELFFSAKSAAGAYYRYFETYTIVCILYFIMTFTASKILRWLEKKMAGPQDYILASDPKGNDPLDDPTGHFGHDGKKGAGKNVYYK